MKRRLLIWLPVLTMTITMGSVLSLGGCAQTVEPVVEEPVVEEPVVEEPAVEDPVIEEPAVEDPVVEDPVVEDPVVEDPVVEDPVVEDPAVEEPEPAREEYGPGIYIVNDDIEPGIYKSEGGVTYFERLAGLSGELGDVLANVALPSGPVYVEIRPTDVAFKTEGGGKWYRIDIDEYQGEMLTSFGDGWYIVGKDIELGRYRSNAGCDYWARLSSFSGELDAIIANSAFDEGTVIVEIQSSDFAFQTQGATWEQVD